MSEPLLCIFNKHYESCGDPPIVSNAADRRQYIGYFENRYGEQWIFEFDHATGSATIRGGDIGRATKLDIKVDSAGRFQIGPDGLILNTEEKLWLGACWLAIKDSR